MFVSARVDDWSSNTGEPRVPYHTELKNIHKAWREMTPEQKQDFEDKAAEDEHRRPTVHLNTPAIDPDLPLPQSPFALGSARFACTLSDTATATTATATSTT